MALPTEWNIWNKNSKLVLVHEFCMKLGKFSLVISFLLSLFVCVCVCMCVCVREREREREREWEILCYSVLLGRSLGFNKEKFKDEWSEFPGGPVVRTPRFHCREPRFSPWLGNLDHASCTARKKGWVEKGTHEVMESMADLLYVIQDHDYDESFRTQRMKNC